MKHIFLSFIFSAISHVFSFPEIRPKICINCQHFIPDHDIGLFGKCSLFPLKPNNNDFLITGMPEEELIDYQYCSVTRKRDAMCGKEGKMHKRKYIKKDRFLK